MKNKNLDFLTLDSATLRRIDENGFLHVTASHISKECVNPYYGREIPGWEDLSLDPERIYQGYRSGEALREGAATFNGLPLLRDHHVESAENPQKEHRVGSLGTDAAFNAPYLDNSLIFTDADAIAAIESGEARELSAAYKYDPDFTPGEFRGEKYDFVMTNIRGNHVALVEEGRAGPDVLVADSQPETLKPKRTKLMGLIDDIKKLLASAQAEGLEPDKGAEGEGAGVPGVTDEANAAAPAEEGNPPAQDDEAALGQELFALLDTITDKDLAGKIKALIEKMRTGGAATDEGSNAAPAEEKDKPAADADAPGENPEKKEGPAMDKNMRKEAPPAGGQAQDAAAVKKATLDHVRTLSVAARDVRPLLDVDDPLAFDAAEDIYGQALKAHGVNTAPYPRSAWRGMCDMLKAQKTESAMPAMDATPKLDSNSPFAGLNRIRVEG